MFPGLLIAFVLSYLAIVLMKYFVRPMVWICVVLMIGSMTYITYYLWNRYDYMKKDIQTQENNGAISVRLLPGALFARVSSLVLECG